MKQMNLKGKKEHKIIKYAFISIVFILSTIFTFNYLNKNIYAYNTKEHLNIFSRISFSFENSAVKQVLSTVFWQSTIGFPPNEKVPKTV